jgi:hypothetical protein
MRPLLALSFLSLAACSGGELVGVHIALQKDGTAVVTTRALVDGPAPSPAEGATKGAAFGSRGALVYSQGTVKDLGQLQFGDESLKLLPRLDGEPKSLRVILQRGPTAGWVKALTPAAPTRQNLAAVYDPSGKTREIADVLRLDVAGLTDVVSSNVLPAARGVAADHESNQAFLVVPANTATTAGPDLVWDITWK